ncbi:MAG: RagB/SusD family nutrient uptake outer membrane protein [Salinibacter sp.]
MRRLLTTFVCLSTAILLASCDVFSTNLNQVNPEEPTEATYYQNLDQLRTGIAGIYSPIQDLYSRSYYFAHDLLSNDAFGTGSLISNLIPINNRVHGAGNGVLNDHWNNFYESIKNANNIIAATSGGIEGVSESDLNRIEAEARFLRAFAYYELVTKYGDVPLILTVREEPEGGVPRTSKDSVYNQILSDLEFAQQHLPTKSNVPQPGRAPKGAAYALEGETHLFLGSINQNQQNWEDARAAFQQVIDLNQYRLMENYFDNFKVETENNAESIFEIQFFKAPNQGTNGRRRMEYGMLGWRNTVPHPQVTSEYEDPADGKTDPRKAATIYELCDPFAAGLKITENFNCGLSGSELKSNPVTQDTRPDWKKYTIYYKEGGQPDTDDGINMRVIRYAEVLVGLAEAQIELGNRTTPGGGSPSARALLNQVRSRVDMPGYPTAGYNLDNYSNAIEALYHEYAVEFAGEQVFYPAQLRSVEHERRPNYLKRRAQSVPKWPERPDYDGGMTPDQTDLVRRYWPIPRSEIESNSAISQQNQNPGY